jgi:preprotein translocase subunit SecD
LPLLCLAAAPPEQGRGLWVGPIHLCRDSVSSAAAAADLDGAPAVTVTLAPEASARLRRETARLIDKPMPVRLDGRVIVAPFVREPITGGVLQLAGLARRDAQAIEAAARRAC